MVQNKYTLVLMNSAFDSLLGTRVLTKQDLHNDLHLVWICDEDEVMIVFNLLLRYSPCQEDILVLSIQTSVRQCHMTWC